MADTGSDDNSNLVDMNDLTNFSKEFFNPTQEVAEVAEEAEVSENEEDHLATDEDTDAKPEDETPDEDEAEEEAKPEPKPKSKTQQRIEQLVTEARTAERERDAERLARESLEKRLQALETNATEKAPEQNPIKELPPEAPNPNALDKDGVPIYRLGEFDPQFISDLADFTIDQRFKAREAKEAELKKAAEVKAAEDALTAEWQTKVSKVTEELPDYQDKVASVGQAFQGIDPAYGNYLATTIMQCDNGPEILYYLSQNIGEAQKIVASGPFAATFEIAKLQAKLEKTQEPEAPSNNTKVSDAPPPPDIQTRGKGGKFAVRPDTRDFAAFKREFFKD